MPLTPQDIATIVAALQESDWDEAVVVMGDARIAVARNGARLTTGPGDAVATPAPVAASPVAAPAAPASSAAAPSNPLPAAAAAPGPSAGTAVQDAEITAPSVGVFWSAPEPGADPYVRVGDRVEIGDTVCIVEVMKLMTNVTAAVAGTISEILVENGEDVEFGTPLFRVREV